MGMDPDVFWKMTPAEFYIKAEAHDRKQRDEANKMLYLAWHTALFARQPKLPALAEIFIKDEPQQPKAQTSDEIMEICKMWTAALGGEFIEV